MTLRWRSGIGPNFTKKELAINQMPSGGFSCPATIAGISPPQTARWLQVNDSASDRGLVQGFTVTPLNVVWLGCRGFIVNGSLTGAGTFSVLQVFDSGGLHAYTIQIVEVSSTTYRFRIQDVDAAAGQNSTNVFDTDTAYTLLWEFDGTNWNFFALPVADSFSEVGDLEATRADVDKPTNINITIKGAAIPSGVIVGFSGIVLVESDLQSEIPDPTTIVVNQSNSNANGPDDEMWDETAGAGSKGDADYTDVNDEDYTDGWQGQAGQDEKQSVELETIAPAQPIGVMVRSVCQATAPIKTCNTIFYMTDHVPNEQTFDNVSIGLNSPQGLHASFPLAPDGLTWQLFKDSGGMPDLRLGVNGGLVGNTANDEW